MAMLDHEMKAMAAANYLSEVLGDGRSYYSMLQDMRRHKRPCRIPSHKDDRGHAWYYKSDLDAFIKEEQKKALSPRVDYLVERDDSSLGSFFPPTKILKALPH